MIQFKEFKSYLDTIRKHIEFEDKINDVFRIYNTDSSFIGNDCGLIGSCIDLLSLAVEDKDDWIGWYLFENTQENKIVKHKDGQEFNINTDEKLYEYITEYSYNTHTVIDKDVEILYDVDDVKVYELKKDLVIKKGTKFTTGIKKIKYKTKSMDSVIAINENDDNSIGYLSFVDIKKLKKYFDSK